MALICMAVYDTAENNRIVQTRRTLECLQRTVNWDHSRLVAIDNASCVQGAALLDNFATLIPRMQVIHNPVNVGTSKAVNQGLRQRVPGEVVVKMDDDVDIYWPREPWDWVRYIEEAMRRYPKAGVVGLKRKDLLESPWAEPAWKSIPMVLPHEPGEPWIYAEKVYHVIGTCHGYSPTLLDRVGELYQMGGLYGFDDSLMAARCQKVGLESLFLGFIPMDHTDPGGGDYQRWKEAYAGKMIGEYSRVRDEILAGTLPVYWKDPE